jgi:hypothetical protein
MDSIPDPSIPIAHQRCSLLRRGISLLRVAFFSPTDCHITKQTFVHLKKTWIFFEKIIGFSN